MKISYASVIIRKQLEIENLKSTYHYNAIKIIKHLGVNLAKYVEDINTKKCRMIPWADSKIHMETNGLEYPKEF